MQSKKLSIGLGATLAILVLTLLAAGTRAVTQQEKLLYDFCSLKNCFDGSYPYAGLIVDAAGNL